MADQSHRKSFRKPVATSSTKCYRDLTSQGLRSGDGGRVPTNQEYIRFLGYCNKTPNLIISIDLIFHMIMNFQMIS